MKFRMLILLFVFAAVLAGCTNKAKDEGKITLENVIQVIQSEGPALVSKGNTDDAFSNLNNTKPNVFDIANPVESTMSESISVYIFDSERDRIEGLTIFNQHMETAELLSYPFVYEQKNATLW